MTASTNHDHPVRLTIGRLARRSGVPVRTIRFWSDEGLVPADRDASGHRVYDAAAVARLDLVRTLRELGLGLDEVRAVLSRRRGVGEIAQAHVRALEGRIRELKAQRAVCVLLARAATGGTGDPDERSVTLMNDLARLSAAERQAMIDEFVTDVFADADPQAPGAGIAEGMRMLPSELPDDPTPEQVAAWVELAELVGDPDFRARCREMAVAGTTEPAHARRQADPAAVTEHAGAAQRAGVDPASPEAAAVLARIPGVADLDAAGRAAAADTVELFSDRRVERYWTLLGTLNGWPAREPVIPAFEWFAAALRAAPVQSSAQP